MKKLWMLLAILALTAASCGGKDATPSPRTQPELPTYTVGEPVKSGNFTVTVNSMKDKPSDEETQIVGKIVNVTAKNTGDDSAPAPLACFFLLDDSQTSASRPKEENPQKPETLKPGAEVTSDIEFLVPAEAKPSQVRFRPCVDGSGGNEVTIYLTDEAAKASQVKPEPVKKSSEVSVELDELAEQVGCGPVSPGTANAPGISEWGACNTKDGTVAVYLVTDIDEFIQEAETQEMPKSRMAIDGDRVVIPDDPAQLDKIREAIG